MYGAFDLIEENSEPGRSGDLLLGIIIGLAALDSG